MSAEEEALLRTVESGGTPYPTMSDADAKDMRNDFILTQTSTRREGGGYIIRRGYYPHKGIIFRRSQFEKELQQVPPARPPSPMQQKSMAAKQEAADEAAPREFLWSENLRVDIPLVRATGQATANAGQSMP